jgi:Zn-dependent peptidase ImmA (M78 family)
VAIEISMDFKRMKLIEIEANAFAQELLMPTEEIVMILKEIPEQNPAVENDFIVEKLAEQYNVSLYNMAMKIASIDGYLKC